MREKRRYRLPVLTGLTILAVAAMITGCIETPDIEIPEDHNYASTPILINNPTLGIIPLPNNFLNPVKQAEFVYFPGIPIPETAPVYMNLPITDAATAAARTALGFPVAEDSDLTKSLVAGMNMLDGWVGSFAPKIPFSKLPDYDSIKAYDGTNGAVANLFLLDITDPASPAVVMPDKYYRVINYERRTEMPYFLSLRKVPNAALEAPADFETGHTYMVVTTGMVLTDAAEPEATDKQIGIKAVVSEPAATELLTAPVQVDSTFLVFAAPDRCGEIFVENPEEGSDAPTDKFMTKHPVSGENVCMAYIDTWGAPVNSILTGLAAAQEAEGARQITNYVLDIWENLADVKDVRKRTEVVAAFQWTVTSNPTPVYFSASGALMGGNSVAPTPSDFVDGSGTFTPWAGKNCDKKIGFSFKGAVAEDTITSDTVKMYSVVRGDKATLTEIPATITPTTSEEGVTSVTVLPTAGLADNTEYVVVATNGIMNAAKTRATVDETYFGLTRVGLPIVEDGTVTGFADNPLVSQDQETSVWTWNSPNLDSRLDTLILNHTSGKSEFNADTDPIRDVTEQQLIDAKDGFFLTDGKFGVMAILKNIEAMRVIYKPLFDALVLDNKLVAKREDIVIGWTFTTGTCN